MLFGHLTNYYWFFGMFIANDRNHSEPTSKSGIWEKNSSRPVPAGWEWIQMLVSLVKGIPLQNAQDIQV